MMSNLFVKTIANARGGSRTDTLIKLVLIFFISLLSFSVGTFVGKQFSDSQHKAAQLEPQFETADREVASVPDHATEVTPENALTETDIIETAQEFAKPTDADPTADHGNSHGNGHGDDQSNSHGTAANDTKHTNEHELQPIGDVSHDTSHAEASHGTHKAEPSQPAAHDSHAENRGVAATNKAQTAPSEAAKRIAEGHAPTEKKVEVHNPLPKELPAGVAASSIGKFTVQVSSHQSEDEAKNKALELKSKGFAAFVVTANVKGQNWYRVSVGLYDTKAEAVGFQGKLKKEAGIAASFVQQITK